MTQSLNPTFEQVREAYFDIYAVGRTPKNAAGWVTSDQIRAFLVRQEGCLVNGAHVSAVLREIAIEHDNGYFRLTST